MKLEPKTTRQQHFSRREFIRTTALAAGAVGVLAASGQAGTQDKDKPEGLPITMAGYNLDRTRALFEGQVNVDGCDFQIEQQGIGDLNTHVFSGPQTLVVSEFFLVSFLLSFANVCLSDYTLLTILQIRIFRLKSIFLRTDGFI